MTPDSQPLTGDYRMQTVLITGGCGFIGTNLIKYLAANGSRCRVLDNLSSNVKEWTADGRQSEVNSRATQSSRNTEVGLPDIDLIIGDIQDEKVVNKAMEGVGSVVHLAARTSVVDSLQSPGESWNVNVNGTLNLLEACRRNGVERFVFASSNAVVGEQPPPIDEMKIPQPLSPYGAAKLAGEALCSAYYHSFGLDSICLRFSNCYGPYSEHKSIVISNFVRQVISGGSLIIYGDGNQTRDFVHVYDVCQAIYRCLSQMEGVAGEVFQIASGIETSINQLVKILCEVTDRRIQPVYKPERKGEILRNYSDISKAGRVMGFAPQITLRRGLDELLRLHIV